jgi:chemotaxis protein methyltransferase CheR
MIGVTELDEFRRAIAERLGLSFDDSKDETLAEVLGRRAAAFGCDPARYPRELATFPHDADELAALAGDLTVPETYFFRNIEQFHALAEAVVPARVKERGHPGTLRVLSAGCASGEEAYTLAMILRDLEPGWDAEILAVDVNPAGLERARRAQFSRWSLRETPADMQDRWFQVRPRGVELDETIRAAVRFERHNLVAEDPALWAAARYDVVFCRNVLMYFTPERARAVVARITRALAPDGFLFLGHAETLRGLSQEFHLCHTHETFYYRRRSAPLVPIVPVAHAAAERAPAVPRGDASDAWVDEIRRASERVARLAAAVPARAPGVAASTWSLDAARELLREERFADAVRAVDDLPAEADGDPDVLLLRSVVLVHAGEVERAEHACERLLAADDLSAGAHYVLALCRESTGDLAGAVEHDRMAVHLDPGFAMARLHLGLLARRAGDAPAMRRELDAAAALLEREDASRLLLFGGGFNRATLIALCRADTPTAASS